MDLINKGAHTKIKNTVRNRRNWLILFNLIFETIFETGRIRSHSFSSDGREFRIVKTPNYTRSKNRLHR